MGWHPIETAPMDTPIILNSRWHVVIAEIGLISLYVGGSYGDYKSHKLVSLKPVGFYGYEWDWEFELSDVTHWMPLPKPPEE